MPAYAVLALLAGLTYGRLLSGRRLRPARALLAAALVLQLALLAYPIDAQIPTPADSAAGAALINRLRALPGPVLVLRHPWYGTIAGKGSFADAEAIGDVLRSGATRGARALHASLKDALDTNHIQALVVDQSFDTHLFGAQLKRQFRLQAKPITPTAPYPLTDLRTAPTNVYLRTHPQPQTLVEGEPLGSLR